MRPWPVAWYGLLQGVLWPSCSDCPPSCGPGSNWSVIHRPRHWPERRWASSFSCRHGTSCWEADPLKVAIFSETFLPKWDGIAHTVCRLLEHLEKRGHESIMFAPEGAPAKYASTEIIGYPSFTCPGYPDLKLTSLGVHLGKEVAQFDPDVIHAVSPFFLGLAGLLRGRSLGIPLVASYHTDVPGYMEKYGVPILREPFWLYFRMVHGLADLNLCPSRFTQAELEAHGIQNVEIWSRGVDAALYHPSKRSEAWRREMPAGNGPVLLYVGRLAPEKRIDLIRPVLDAVPGSRLAIVGDGPIRDELERLFEGTPTRFLGYLKGEDLATAYASSDIFVFPSENETFGNVVMEAMASGVPVIAARRGGPVEHVVDGRNGFLHTPGSVGELSGLVRLVATNTKLASDLARGAREYASTRTWEAVMDGLLEKYETLIETTRRRRELRPPAPPRIRAFWWNDEAREDGEPQGSEYTSSTSRR
ncbi:MAG: glycosyltransferase [Candidatus Eisenbacteria bacterium]|nr:glycosyltransferase [Candidatus Eisenbacteria bacterium]